MDPIAEIDQIQSEMRGLTRMMSRYFDDIIEAGSFTDEQAFTLVRDWHLNYWQTIHVPPTDDAGHGAPTSID